MGKIKKVFVFAALLLVSACGNANTDSTQSAETETQIVAESDSLSADLSAAGDSVEKKINDLQSTLDSLNN
ncbi:MAG: hypothetical protein ACNS64_01725 [Candidatus Halalkalibacterium sp. M3_1C_030]